MLQTGPTSGQLPLKKKKFSHFSLSTDSVFFFFFAAISFVFSFSSLKMLVLGFFFFFISMCWAGPAPFSKTINVDWTGHGDFTKLQDAINSVPINNQQWVLINLRPGSYR